MRALTLLLVCGVPLAGCAGQTEMRMLAGDTTSIMNDYRREMSAFAARQTAANADNEVRVANLRATRAGSEAYVGQRLLAIKVAGDKDSLEIYDLLAKNGADQLVAMSPLLNDAAVVPVAPVVKFDGSAIEALTRKLNALRKPPTYWDRVGQVIAYGEGLRTTYAKSLEEAGNGAGGADEQAELAAGTLTVPALPPATEDK